MSDEPRDHAEPAAEMAVDALGAAMALQALLIPMLNTLVMRGVLSDADVLTIIDLALETVALRPEATRSQDRDARTQAAAMLRAAAASVRGLP